MYIFFIYTKLHEYTHAEAINGGNCVREGGMEISHGPSNCEHCVCSST